MTIKDISSLSGVRPVDASRNHSDTPSRHEPGKAEEPAARTDQVTLSSVGQLLSDSADSAPPVDRARVEALRAAIADGSYKPDAEQIAAKLTRMERELL